MILACGVGSEPPVALVIEAAERAGTECLLVNQRESHFADALLRVGADGIGGRLWLREREYDLESVTGVFVRLMDWQCLPENRPRRSAAEDGRREASRRFHETLLEWIEVTGARVMNRSRPSASNMSKPYQAQLIRSVGFCVPETLITNRPEDARSFAAEHGTVVYKSTSAVRSIVRVLDAAALERLPLLRWLPTQFQRCIPGVDVRVHVVGDDLFATEVCSEAVDYRYAGRDDEDVDMRAVTLPPEVALRCFELSRRLELPLCGIDLRRTEDERYYCFEANPAPAFSYYQEQTGQPIARAIVSYLSTRQRSGCA